MTGAKSKVSSRARPVLRWRIITALLLVSLLPLLVMGGGAWIVFGRMFEERALQLQAAVVARHALAIDSYLNERLHLLQVLAETHSLTELSDAGHLRAALESLNRASSGAFTDLGVIDDAGRHLAYVGPHDLAGRNYREADWFREVMAGGEYLSDVFLGYRQVPHCIIAAKVVSGGTPWILRATVNSEQFAALVRTGELGAGSDAFLVNREGRYQTKPRVGEVLDPAPWPVPAVHSGVQDRRLELNGRTLLAMTTWVNGQRWLLVVLQDLATVRAPVNRALAQGALPALLAILLIATTVVLATHHLTGQIDRANAQREEMLGAFLRSAKLASVGELATGLAHEINNPLAIISAQQTNVADLVQEMDPATPGRDQVLDSVARTQQQVQRCGGITAKMLQFGRKHETSLEPTEIAPRMQEIVRLMERQAGVANVALELDAAPDLPPVLLDPLELEQVLVNLIKNALDAQPEGGRVIIRAHRAGDELRLEVQDEGPGVPPELLERIFEPFFTTKPAGKGTGLGLSVCYGVVQSWGGRIEAESGSGRGLLVRIRLPLRDLTATPGSTPTSGSTS
jgi:two-component system NtrC family sensor kinase